MRKAVLTVALLLALLLSSQAQANYDPIGSGTTKLTLDHGFLAEAKKVGVSISAKAPAKRQGKVIVLPVFGGKADPTIKKAQIEQEGAILFSAAKRKIPLRSIELKAKPTPLFAKVGGSQLKVASSKATTVGREGFGTSLRASGLALTQKVATRLNKKLQTKDFFYEGQLIGTIKSQTQPQRVTILPQGQGTIAIDPAFFAKLKSLFVSLNPISPAELSPGPILRFPIAAGGQIAPSGSAGTLRLGGAIELLQLGAGQVFHKEYWLDLSAMSVLAEVDVEPTPAFPGKLGQIGVFDLDLGAATLSSDPQSRAISLTAAPLRLQAQTAQTFNQAFAEGRAAFVAGEAFGSVSFGAVGQ